MTRTRRPRATRWLRQLAPPFRSLRFWVIQVVVVAVAIVHDLVVASMLSRSTALGLPVSLTSALLLIPVIYAAMNFGVGGAVGTAGLEALLAIPHWILLKQQELTVHLSIEVVNFVVLMAVAVVVGQQVDRQRLARRRAEAALASASMAETRYRALFEDQPSPVIITDCAGIVGELNAAATQLVGEGAVGRPLEGCLGGTLAELSRSSPIVVRHPTRGEQHYLPLVREVATALTASVQIVLTDCTEEFRRQQEQRVFTARLMSVQEEERRSLARDLHDDPLQSVTYVALSLDDLIRRDGLPDWADVQLRGLSSVSKGAATALRKLIRGLRPPVLDDLGLIPALRQLCEDVAQRTAVEVRLSVIGEAGRLSDPVELNAYRIVQESLNNVARHASAKNAFVNLHFDKDLAITVGDDGRGFPGGRLGRQGDTFSIGLAGMAERAAVVGGLLEVRSTPGRGTTVRATLPLPGGPPVTGPRDSVVREH